MLKYQCTISISDSKESFYCDNPVDSNATKPSPRELLLGSLGSCTAMTIRTYFENSQVRSTSWRESKLEAIHVRIEEEMGADLHVPIGIKLHIQLYGHLSAAQIESLKRAADLCPVKRMITGNNGNSSYIRTQISI